MLALTLLQIIMLSVVKLIKIIWYFFYSLITNYILKCSFNDFFAAKNKMAMTIINLVSRKVKINQNINFLINFVDFKLIITFPEDMKHIKYTLFSDSLTLFFYCLQL